MGSGPSAGDDHFVGDSGNNQAFGLAGDDLLEGGDGDDQLWGDAYNGDEAGSGVTGNDHLIGGAGDDYLSGGLGDDLLEGGSGHDYLISTFGDDRLFAGDDNDSLRIFSPDGEPPRTIAADAGAGDDEIEVTVSNGLNLTLTAGAGNDLLSLNGQGEALSIHIDMGAGDDVIDAMAYGDRFGGVLQVDVTLGAGRDLIYLESYAGAVLGLQYHITDFQAGAGGDELDFTAILDRFDKWDGGNPFTQGYLQLRQEGAASILRFDSDGWAGVGSWQEDLVVFDNTRVGDFTAANFHGIPPDGGAMPGLTLTHPGRYVQGSIGNDTITASGSGGNYLGNDVYGRAGDDYMESLDQYPRLHGGDGDDHLVSSAQFLYYARDPSVLFGDAGNDRLDGSRRPDTLHGGDGADGLYGGKGDDLLDGGAGDDHIDGGEGLDIVSFGDMSAALTLEITNAGAVTTAAYGTDTLADIEGFSGTSYNDTLSISLATTSGFILMGGDGNDVLTGGGGLDFLIGGHGNDMLIGRGGLDIASYRDWSTSLTLDLRIAGPQLILPGTLHTLVDIRGLEGTLEGDVLTGDDYDNLIYGDGPSPNPWLFIQGGADLIRAGGGADEVHGGAGNDLLFGEVGADVLYGDRGNDTLDGGAQDDRLYGGAGEDSLKGGSGNDLIDGGDGQDTLALTGDVRDYTVLMRGNDFVVRGLAGTGSDLVANVERISFNGSLTMIDFSTFEAQSFNAYGYLASYADLRIGYKGDPVAARKHYLEHGVAEGRDPGLFNALEYAASNIDLARAFGADTFMLAQHYVQHGGCGRTRHDHLRYVAVRCPQ